MTQISVVMSCYNAARWLDEAVASLTSQTLRDIEIIAVNDGSTDNTKDILSGFAAKDARVRIIDKPNTGLADSLNVGVSVSKGDWIARLDADDLAEPDRLERQLALVLSNPEIGLLGSGCTIIDSAGIAGKVYSYPADHDALVSRMKRVTAFFPHSSTLFRRDIFNSLGGYRPQNKRAEDIDLWLRLSERTKLASLPEPLIRLRKHDAQISHMDEGRRQLIDAYAAVTCHYLRAAGESDPMSHQDTSTSFLHWVESEMNSHGVFDAARHWLLATSEFRSSPSKPVGLARMAWRLAVSGKPAMVLSSRLRGATLPAALANRYTGTPAKAAR